MAPGMIPCSVGCRTCTGITRVPFRSRKAAFVDMVVSLAHGQLVLMQVPQVTRGRNATQDCLAFSGSLGMGAGGLYGRNAGSLAPPVQSRTCSGPASGSAVVLASARQSRACKQTRLRRLTSVRRGRAILTRSRLWGNGSHVSLRGLPPRRLSHVNVQSGAPSKTRGIGVE